MKKLLTLFTLLLTVCSGAWGDPTQTYDLTGYTGSAIANNGCTALNGAYVGRRGSTFTPNETYGLATGSSNIAAVFAVNQRSTITIILNNQQTSPKTGTIYLASVSESYYTNCTNGTLGSFPSTTGAQSVAVSVIKNGNAGENEYTFSSSVEEGKYIVWWSSGINSNIFLSRIEVNVVAPATPTFNPASGEVEQGNTVSVTSSGADKIYYAWSDTEIAPATPASWSNVAATAGVGNVPVPGDVTGTRYLYAYGKNDLAGTQAHATYTIVEPKTATTLSFVSPTTTVKIGESVTNTPTLTPAAANDGAEFIYASSDESIATVDENTGEVTGVAVGSATITATYAGNSTYSGSSANYTINVPLTAVNDKFWNGGDWTSNYAGTYTGSKYIDNMEIKGTSSIGVQVTTGGSKTIEGHTVAARIRLGQAGSADGNYLHFKVKPNTTITYWGIRASSGAETDGLALSFGTFGENEQTYTFTAGDVESMTYTYTGAEETDVYAYSKNSAGASMLAIKVEPYEIDTESPTISTEQNEEDATIGTPLNLTVIASHYTGLQWYKAEESNLSDAAAIDGATSATYAFTAVKADALKTYYFYCVATNDNATGEKVAQSDAITVTIGDYERSTECKALQVVYSNGFDAFITHPVAETYYVAEDEEVIAGTKNVGDIKTTATNGRVVAYYVAGSSVPTISSTILSDDASYNVVGTTLTVTAEDGTTTGVYDISLTAVEPYLGGDITFDGTESWVKAPYGFIDTKGYKYQRLKRDNENTDPWDRLTPGNTRIYLFLGANTSVTLKTTNSNGNVDVKVNTVTVKDNQAWGDGKAIEVTNDLNAPYLLGIYSHQTSGDNYVSSIEITKPTTVSGTISEADWNTFSSNYALDLSTISGGTAYVAKTNDNTEVTMTKTTAKIAAGTGIMIKGNAGDTFTISTTTDAATLEADNQLVGLPNGGTVAANAYNFVFAWETGDVSTAGFYYVDIAAPTLPAGKAYLNSEGVNGAKLNIVIDDTPSQEETDGIKAVSTKVENGVRYNLAGQKVGADYKGIVIVNGKKYLRK